MTTSHRQSNLQYENKEVKLEEKANFEDILCEAKEHSMVLAIA